MIKLEFSKTQEILFSLSFHVNEFVSVTDVSQLLLKFSLWRKIIYNIY